MQVKHYELTDHSECFPSCCEAPDRGEEGRVGVILSMVLKGKAEEDVPTCSSYCPVLLWIGNIPVFPKLSLVMLADELLCSYLNL